MNGLRRGNRCVRIAHGRGENHPALDDHCGLHAEESRFPEHDVRKLANFDRTDLMTHAMCERGIDRVFGNVAPYAKIVIASSVLTECAALYFHLVRCLPGSRDHFSNASHRL